MVFWTNIQSSIEQKYHILQLESSWTLHWHSICHISFLQKLPRVQQADNSPLIVKKIEYAKGHFLLQFHNITVPKNTPRDRHKTRKQLFSQLGKFKKRKISFWNLEKKLNVSNTSHSAEIMCPICSWNVQFLIKSEGALAKANRKSHMEKSRQKKQNSDIACWENLNLKTKNINFF